MKYNPDIHHRRSIRLKGYDYSRCGAYFVTLCAHKRAMMFGQIIDGTMELNGAGKMTDKWWQKIPEKFNAQLDEYIIMPNHLHGIIVIVRADPYIYPAKKFQHPVGADPCVCPDKTVNLKEKSEHIPIEGEHIPIEGEHMGSPLHSIVQWFKTMTTNEYIINVKNNNWPPFDKKIWQRNYYERIIRNEKECRRIRQYIMDNPLKWEFDTENPKHIKHDN